MARGKGLASLAAAKIARIASSSTGMFVVSKGSALRASQRRVAACSTVAASASATAGTPR